MLYYLYLSYNLKYFFYISIVIYILGNFKQFIYIYCKILQEFYKR